MAAAGAPAAGRAGAAHTAGVAARLRPRWRPPLARAAAVVRQQQQQQRQWQRQRPSLDAESRREALAAAHMAESAEEAAMRVLEWPQVLAQLRGFARTPLGERACGAGVRGAPVGASRQESAALLRETREAAGAPSAYHGLKGAVPLTAAMRACRASAAAGGREGGAAPPAGEQLWAVAATAQAAMGTLAELPASAALRELPRLRCEPLGEGGGGEQLAQLIQDVFAAVRDSRGALSYDASPKLAELRSKERKLGLQVDDMLRELHAELQGKSATPAGSPEVVLRRGRACLAVREDRRVNVLPDAAVLAMSSSGATAYVETTEATAINNELERLRAEVEAEAERVLRELGAAVVACEDAVLAAQRWVELADLAQARAQHAAWLGAVEPELVDAGLRLERMRHPIMLASALPPATPEGESKDQEQSSAGRPAPPVPFDVSLDPKTTAVVISGPNAGGKTAVLKAVGLAALMAKAGMFVPADAARVPWWPAVLAVIGDAQSLGENLSTFSGQLSRFISAHQAAAEASSSLLLVDELGSGTDPVEGAALAYALLRRRAAGEEPGVGLGGGNLAIATTHFDRLRNLADEPSLAGRVANAAVEFDYEALRPTYRLLWGGPGASNAIAVAAALGCLDEDVLEDARRELENMKGAAGEGGATVMREAAERRAEALYAPLLAELEVDRERADIVEAEAEAAAVVRDAARSAADEACAARDAAIRAEGSGEEGKARAEAVLREALESLEDVTEAMKDVTAAKASAWTVEGGEEVDRILAEFMAAAPEGVLVAASELNAEFGQLFPKAFGIDNVVHGEIVLEKRQVSAADFSGLSRKQRRALENAARDGDAASVRAMGRIMKNGKGGAPRKQTPGAFGDVQRQGDAGGGGEAAGSEASQKLDAQTNGNTLMLAGSGLYPSDAPAEIDRWLNSVALAGGGTLYIMHGQGSGKMRDAVHAKLKKTGWVKNFWLDPEHGGKTICVF